VLEGEPSYGTTEAGEPAQLMQEASDGTMARVNAATATEHVPASELFPKLMQMTKME
jgi:hypothetical protein